MDRFVAALVFSLTASACFSSSTVVKVRADGSGSIQVSTSLSKAAIAELDAQAVDMGGTPQKATLEQWLPEMDARAAASRLGAGVRFVSTRATQDARSFRRVTVYEYADIRRLTLEPIPILPAQVSSGGTARLEGEHRLTFDLSANSDTGFLLTARLPDARIEYAGLEVGGDQTTETDPEGLALARKLFSGARFDVTIEPDLPVISTNTPHRSGQRITLVAIDVERLAFDEVVWKRLVQPGSLDELRYQLHDVPGVTISLDREVRIELAPR